MKTRSLLYRFSFCTACALLLQPVLGMGQTAEAQYGDTANASIVERGPHHRIWEKVWYEQGPSGEAVERRSRVTEIASGLHYWNPAAREWTESIEEFQVTQDGYAVATNGQHKVIISPVLNDAGGAVDLLTPEGHRLRSTILALNIHNRVTGQSVLVAEVATNSAGYLVAPNEIVFSNAFDGFAADVRFVFKKGEFHQDVIVREGMDFELLRAAGFPAEDSEWEIWTEFFEAPEPRIESRIARSELNPSRRALMAEPDLLDEDLDFGAMKMPVGAAYLRTGRGETRKEINVFKRWLKIEGGSFLLESMPLDNLQPLFSDLGEGALNSNPVAGKKMYAGRRSPSPALRRPQAETILAAASSPAQEFDRGVHLVMDYVTVNGNYYDYVFRGGEWYRVSGPVYLYTTGGNKTVVEGNTVVKFAKNASAKLVFNGPIEFRTSHYKPAVFTAYDDRSIGETYSFGNGSPTGYYATTALEFNYNGNLSVQHVRVAYAQTAMHFRGASSAVATDTLRNIQIRDCGTGIYVQKDTYERVLDLGNALFSKVTQPFNGYRWSGKAQHVTVDQSTTLAGDTGAAAHALNFTNSIFVSVTGLGTGIQLGGSHNAFRSTTSFGVNSIALSASPFVTVESGQYYLETPSLLRNAGTANLSADMLATLKKTTTYPPVLYSNVTLSVATDFAPQAQRDNDVPDLGWHYDPLDYVFGGCHAEANLTFKPGTAVGWFRTSSGWGQQGYGIHVTDYKTVAFEGTVAAPAFWVRTTSVQERKNGAFGLYGPGGLMGWATTAPATPTVTTRHTVCANMDEGGLSNHFRDYGWFVVRCTDSEFWAGHAGGYGARYYFTNCLFDRTALWLDNQDPIPTMILRNCTMYGGIVSFSHRGGVNWYSSIRDSAFDGTAITIEDNSGGNPAYVDYNYNAFLQGASRTTPQGANDVLVSTFNWQTGPLGGFYLPSSSTLINAGSRAANLAGLYHYTTQTAANSKETTSTVDIGFHYVGVNTTGSPIDTDGDGIPDYLEDQDGDGGFDSGETNWQTSENGTTGVHGLQVFTVME